jgi:hypothetical protein
MIKIKITTPTKTKSATEDLWKQVKTITAPIKLPNGDLAYPVYAYETFSIERDAETLRPLGETCKLKDWSNSL